jgi:dTDP-4-dehydrorhamnose reductase
MYLVIGAGGYLGSYLLKNILERTEDRVIGTYHSSSQNLPFADKVLWVQLDVTDPSSVDHLIDVLKARKKDGETVKCVYTAGYIKPDDCLRNPDLAVRTNVLALLDFLSKAKELLDGLLFTSSDFVFNISEDETKYSEVNQPDPINYYGTIKLVCEKIIRTYGFSSVRLPFMFGKSLNPSRPHFIEHVERVGKGLESFEVLCDYYENSLDYNTVAKLIVRLFEEHGPKFGFTSINVCADKKVSKYEIAVQYATKAGLDPSGLKPISLSSADFFLAKRGTILMDNTFIKSLLGLKDISFEV